MKSIIKKFGSTIHHWHDSAFTFWKVRETGIKFDDPLNYEERMFFLEFRSVLAGNALTIYDIGAANGVLSSCFAKLHNVQAVHAFEPIPSAYAELTERTKHNPKVKRHNFALGAENTEMNIWITSDSRDSSSLLKMQSMHKVELPYAAYIEQPEKIEVVRLDDFVQENNIPLPNIVKIDVQGYEDRVLRGGTNTISHAAFVILEMSFVSLYDGSPLFDDIYRQMRDQNFQLVGMGGELRGISGRYLQADGIFQNLKNP